MATKHHAHSHKHEKVDAEDALRNAGLKVTKPRLAILDLLASEHGPFTPDEIHVRVTQSKAAGACDLVTIYRCLAKFEGLSLINRCDFGDGTVRYELGGKDHHHHHIICRICKRVDSLPDCPVEDKSIKMPKTGFRNVSHRLEFFGICPDCYAD